MRPPKDMEMEPQILAIESRLMSSIRDFAATDVHKMNIDTHRMA